MCIFEYSVPLSSSLLKIIIYSYEYIGTSATVTFRVGMLPSEIEMQLPPAGIPSLLVNNR